MEKVVRGWLIVDVMKSNMRVVKKIGRRPLKASEVAIQLKLDIEVPDKPILKAEGKITLSKTQLSNMLIESLIDASEDELK